MLVAAVVFSQSHVAAAVCSNVVPYVVFAKTRLEVALVKLDHELYPDGRSVSAIARNVGAATGPETGPAKNVAAVWVFSVAVKVPTEVTGADGVEDNTVPSPVKVTDVTPDRKEVG